MASFGYRADLLSSSIRSTLDHLRWVAALAVCANHLRNLLFPDADQAGPLNLFGKAFYFLTLFGPEAVAVFFVISGTLVGGSILRHIRAGSFSPASYAIDRATRLYLVLLPAVVLTLALQWDGLTVTCPTPDGFGVVLANLTHLQNVISEPLCNNHPLWSLSSEAFFYLAAPALFLAATTRSVKSLAISIVCLFVAAYSWNGTHTSPAFGALLWTAGLIPWFLQLRMSPWLPLGAFVLAISASRLHLFGNEFISFPIITLCLVAVLCCARSERPWREGAISRTGTGLAAFSYSLYLVHMPLAQAIAVLQGAKLNASRFESYVIYFAALVLIVAVAWLFGRLFEAHTDWLRKVLRDRLRPQSWKARARTIHPTEG